MKCAYSSNIGAKRRVNQDAYLAAAIDNNEKHYYVFAVADGLGGRLAGDIASKTAVEFIKNNLSQVKDYFDYDEMNNFVADINQAIITKSYEDANYNGMATTLTMAILEGETMGIVHVGDSRAYRLNGDKMEQLTKDHSLVQVLIDEGKLTEDEARYHPQRNVITRALGTDNSVHIDLYKYKIDPGDIILLCTDGLYNLVEDNEIKRIVMENDLETAAKDLINLANYNGGTDNITLIIFNPEGEVVAGD